MKRAATATDFLDAIRDDRGPWAIATVAFVACGIALTYTIEHVHDSLTTGSERVLSGYPSDSIRVTVDGRDINLDGEIDTTTDRERLVAELAAMEGVGVVRDRMRELDPAEQHRLESTVFRQRLQNVDAEAIRFETGRSVLAESATVVLDEVAGLLDRYPDTRIRIAGHTDSRGSPNANLRISRERARAVAAALAERGVAPDRLIAQGYGDTQPIADNDTEAGRAANRRIGFSFVD